MSDKDSGNPFPAIESYDVGKTYDTDSDSNPDSNSSSIIIQQALQTLKDLLRKQGYLEDQKQGQEYQHDDNHNIDHSMKSFQSSLYNYVDEHPYSTYSLEQFILRHPVGTAEEINYLSHNPTALRSTEYWFGKTFNLPRLECPFGNCGSLGDSSDTVLQDGGFFGVVTNSFHLRAHDLVGNTFQISCNFMLAFTMFFLIQGVFVVPRKWKASVCICGLVTGIAWYNYTFMTVQWIYRQISPVSFRYIDWIVTVPMQVLQFYWILRTVGVDNDYSKRLRQQYQDIQFEKNDKLQQQREIGNQCHDIENGPADATSVSRDQNPSMVNDNYLTVPLIDQQQQSSTVSTSNSDLENLGGRLFIASVIMITSGYFGEINLLTSISMLITNYYLQQIESGSSESNLNINSIVIISQNLNKLIFFLIGILAWFYIVYEIFVGDTASRANRLAINANSEISEQEIEQQLQKIRRENEEQRKRDEVEKLRAQSSKKRLQDNVRKKNQDIQSESQQQGSFKSDSRSSNQQIQKTSQSDDGAGTKKLQSLHRLLSHIKTRRAALQAFLMLRVIVSIGWSIYPLGYWIAYFSGSLGWGNADNQMILNDTSRLLGLSSGDSSGSNKFQDFDLNRLSSSMAAMNVIFNFADLINKGSYGLCIWGVAIRDESGMSE